MSRIGCYYLLKNQRINTRLLASEWEKDRDTLIHGNPIDRVRLSYYKNYLGLSKWHEDTYVYIEANTCVTIRLSHHPKFYDTVIICGKYADNLHAKELDELVRKLREINVTKPDDLYLYMRLMINYFH